MISNKKNIKFALSAPEQHWVGNGFFVHGMLRPTPELVSSISPFILMDYGSPRFIEPTTEKLGVGEHPHRGFETVTFAYQGEVEHRDSAGGGGTIKEGEVQWMTAGRGLVHDEFHSRDFAKRGGMFEMVQLWVNLPKKDKMTTPKYQNITLERIPTKKIDDNITLRLIAGQYEELKGPAETFTPMNIYDIRSQNCSQFTLKLPESSNTVILILQGNITIEEKEFSKSEILIFERQGEIIDLKIEKDTKLLVLNGDPIDEPIVPYGPFVMNTKEEITQAIEDFRSGKLGSLA